MQKTPRLVLATACDKKFAWQALNLVGSVQVKSSLFDAIYVYDLGMTTFQKSRFNNIPNLKVRHIHPFVTHWQQCWSWKPWIWNDVPGDIVIFLDAGTQVLRSLKPMIELINKDDYFVVSQMEAIKGGHPLADIIPKDYYDRFNLNKKLGSEPVVAAGIIGFKRPSLYYDKVILETLRLVIGGYNLGWSELELNRNAGINYIKEPPIRDCKLFRHDQTLFNLLLYKFDSKPVVSAFDQFAAFRSPAEHPQQLIWNARLYNPLRLVHKIEYTKNSKRKNFINGLAAQVSKLTSGYYPRVFRLKIKQALER